MGVKACGGPSEYIAFPKELKAEILEKIDAYTQKQMEYNQQNPMMSDCALVMPPTALECVNGKAVFSGSLKQTNQETVLPK